jgi:hypothetical protein
MAVTGRGPITIRIGTLRVHGVSAADGPAFRAALTQALARMAPALAGAQERPPSPSTRAEAAAAAVLAAARRRMPR